MKRENLPVIFFAFLSTVLLFACKTHPIKQGTQASGLSVDSVLWYMADKAFVFNNMQFKTRIEIISEGKTQSFTATVRMKNDSIIWASVSPMLGIEALRFCMTQDSVKIINKLNNTYFLSDINYLKTLLGADMDFNMLQAVITGNDFPHFEADSLALTTSSNTYCLSHKHRAKLRNKYNNSRLALIQKLYIDCKSFKIIKNYFSDTEEKYKFEWLYSDFKSLNSRMLAHHIEGSMETSNKKWVVKINIEKIVLQNDLNFSFVVPANYTPMSQ
ncbi:MAG: hypothetical protein BWY70_00087 [Bacteroidetes bacterium ADurb.Bin408]|nr:MAG: hypothetical protein BWY70_00087 [Bacteroidetes bacterium ADurb.Bin408]